MSVKIEELTWADVAAALENPRTVVVLPVGSIEQHGLHLPLGTDSLNVEYYCVEAARQVANVLVLPCQKFGVSGNHRHFPGTVSLSPDTLVAVVLDTTRSYHRHGCRRFLIVNGHGGNNATLDVAAIKAREEMPGFIIGHAYVGGLGKEAYRMTFTSGVVYHAEETETSCSLVTIPHLVQMEKAVQGMDPAFTGYYHRYYKPEGEMYGKVSYGLPDTISLSPTGVMGDATVASRQKGEAVVPAMVADLAAIYRDIQAARVLPPLR